MSHQDPIARLDTLDLLVEVAPGEGCLAHIPALPGLCFRANDPEEAQRIASGQIADYVEWLSSRGIPITVSASYALLRRASIRDFIGVRVVEMERRVGSPVWVSGNPAVLFDYDRHALCNRVVDSHLRFARSIAKHIRAKATRLYPEQRDRKPAANRRSVNEMLTHIGDCVWWYCSRIDNELPEPEERKEEDPADRMKRLLDDADEYLRAVPLLARMTVHIPSRFRTKNPYEEWTHTKVCRRQAEHLWEHLQALKKE
jgi:predicted RNase H-like HicB family nuclease